MNNDRFKFRVAIKQQDGSFNRLDVRGIKFRASGFTVDVRENRCMTIYEVDGENVILEQCTGLKDQSGKLIFEGDVVDYYCPMADDHYQGVVTFDDNETTASGYYIKGNREGKYDSYLDGSHCRIIGNVHQVEDFGNEKN